MEEESKALFFSPKANWDFLLHPFPFSSISQNFNNPILCSFLHLLSFFLLLPPSPPYFFLLHDAHRIPQPTFLLLLLFSSFCLASLLTLLSVHCDFSLTAAYFFIYSSLQHSPLLLPPNQQPTFYLEKVISSSIGHDASVTNLEASIMWTNNDRTTKHNDTTLLESFALCSCTLNFLAYCVFF